MPQLPARFGFRSSADLTKTNAPLCRHQSAQQIRRRCQ
jgi:hypothetical protein